MNHFTPAKASLLLCVATVASGFLLGITELKMDWSYMLVMAVMFLGMWVFFAFVKDGYGRYLDRLVKENGSSYPHISVFTMFWFTLALTNFGVSVVFQTLRNTTESNRFFTTGLVLLGITFLLSVWDARPARRPNPNPGK